MKTTKTSELEALKTELNQLKIDLQALQKSTIQLSVNQQGITNDMNRIFKFINHCIEQLTLLRQNPQPVGKLAALELPKIPPYQDHSDFDAMLEREYEIGKRYQNFIITYGRNEEYGFDGYSAWA